MILSADIARVIALYSTLKSYFLVYFPRIIFWRILRSWHAKGKSYSKLPYYDYVPLRCNYSHFCLPIFSSVLGRYKMPKESYTRFSFKTPKYSENKRYIEI